MDVDLSPVPATEPATPRRARHRRFFAATVIAAVIVAAVLVSGWSTCGFRGCPDVERLASYRPGGAPVLLDRDGEPFGDLAPMRREMVPLRALPRYVPDAFVAIEDQRFRAHGAVDWRRVAGAFAANVRAHAFRQGFSTITMQLARNVFPETIPGRERTARRKLFEIRIAHAIEGRFSKDAILELYLNHIYFGNGLYGIAAAAEQYFGVPAQRLTLPQAALLAALPKAPTHYDPRRHARAARARRNLVLAAMARQHRVATADAEHARAAALGVVASHTTRAEAAVAPYFVEEVRRRLEARFGDATYAEPLRIHTTLDVRAQRAAEEELVRQLRAVEGSRAGNRGAATAANADALEGAVVALDAATGDVLAWVGGRDFGTSQFDRVTGAHRQAGSAFKPFVYAAAIAKGLALSQPIRDAPLTVHLDDGTLWEPRNFTDVFDGTVTVREALVRSKNVATVRLAQAVGYDPIIALAERAGIRGPLERVPAMALGTVAVSPLEVTAAYTAFANLGDRVEPRLVTRIENAAGDTVWSIDVSRRRTVNPGVAFLVTDALRDALDLGSGTAARQAGFRGVAAGKTGTTNDAADAWFVGFTPDVVAGVWIGYDQPRTISARGSGGRLAAPVWGRMMARLYRDRRAPKPWPLPSSVRVLPVDTRSGLLVAEECVPPGGTRHRELFLVGMEPRSICPGREPAQPGGFVIEVGGDEDTNGRERDVRAIPAGATTDDTAPPVDRRATSARGDDASALRRRDGRIDDAPAVVPRTAHLDDPRDGDVDEDDVRDDDVADEDAHREDAPFARAPRPGDDARRADVTGAWELTNVVTTTSVPEYEGLRLVYRLVLEQDGATVHGVGRKILENGRPIPAGGQTPLAVEGTVAGDGLTLRFVERGARRATNGRFRWRVVGDGDALRGAFVSTAAESSGVSSARRIR